MVKVARRRLAACVLLVALLAGAVCLSGSAGVCVSPRPFSLVPQVETLTIAAAFAELRQLGFRVALPHPTFLLSNLEPFTEGVTPVPGTRVRRGAVVLITASPSRRTGDLGYDEMMPARLRVPN